MWTFDEVHTLHLLIVSELDNVDFKFWIYKIRLTPITSTFQPNPPLLHLHFLVFLMLLLPPQLPSLLPDLKKLSWPYLGFLLTLLIIQIMVLRLLTESTRLTLRLVILMMSWFQMECGLVINWLLWNLLSYLSPSHSGTHMWRSIVHKYLIIFWWLNG